MRELRKQYIDDSLKLPKIKGQNRNSWTLHHTHKKKSGDSCNEFREGKQKSKAQ